VQEFANKTVKSVDELMNAKLNVNISEEFNANPAYHFQTSK